MNINKFWDFDAKRMLARCRTGTVVVAGAVFIAALCGILLFKPPSNGDERLVNVIQQLEKRLENLEDVISQSSSDQRNRHKALSADLMELKRQNESFQSQLSLYQNRRLEIAESLRNHVLALGVQYVDTSGKTKVDWSGTGFIINESAYCLTAAHVLEELNTQKESRLRAELPAECVAKNSNGAVLKITLQKRHPLFPGKQVREAATPTVFFKDVGIFKCETDGLSDPLPKGLKLCRNVPTAIVGEEVAVGGFPTEVSTIGYLQQAESRIVPTIRFGFTERVTSFDTRQQDTADLLQHDIPTVGGFSGAPIVNLRGEVVGIATEATHRVLNGEEIMDGETRISRKGYIRLLDAAHISFAVDIKHVIDWLAEETP